MHDEDLAVLVDQWADPIAAHIAAFTARPITWTGMHSSDVGLG